MRTLKVALSELDRDTNNLQGRYLHRRCMKGTTPYGYIGMRQWPRYTLIKQEITVEDNMKVDCRYCGKEIKP